MERFNQRIENLREKADFSYDLSMSDAIQLKQLIEQKMKEAPALADLYIDDDTIKITRTKKFFQTIDDATIDFEKKSEIQPQQGIYVFIYQNHVVYFGITRKLHNRLRAHCFSKVRSSSNLASLLCKNDQNEKNEITDEDLRDAAKFIRNHFRFLFIPIQHFTKKYWLEVTLAHLFKAPLNSFKTH